MKLGWVRRHKKFYGRLKEKQAYNFIKQKVERGEHWVIAQNHGEFCLVFREIAKEL